MVVSTAKQLESTYQLWQRFSFPTENRSWDAIAVPAWVGDKLNSAYAIIISLALVHFWTIIISLILYFSLRRYKHDASKLDPLAATLWNKRADLADSVIETIAFSKTDWARPWVPVTVFLALTAWVAQTATGVVVPPLIILDHAAPVNPAAIYVPDLSADDSSTQAARFALDVPRYFRALGSAVIDEDLREKVRVSPVERLGQTDNGEEILRIDYGYRVTGADFGIQKYFDLTLDVTGSCVTEYAWHQNTETAEYRSKLLAIDYYYVFNDQSMEFSASLFDGTQPSATFFLGELTKGTLDTSNNTWAAVVSSVNRTSFSAGTDPWYLTEPASGNMFSVVPVRPALSCWQDDVWSYRGHNSTSDVLTSDALPGLGLSESLQGLIAQYLGSPIIVPAGSHLRSSALLSSTTSLGQIFDAGASSIYSDFERLVLAAYVATTNILTDTTLYPSAAAMNVPNGAVGDDGKVSQDTAGFVVWSPEVATLSTVIIIAIPTVFVAVWSLALILIYYTPIKIVTLLDSSSMQENLKENNPVALNFGDDEEGRQPEEKSSSATKPAQGEPPQKSEAVESSKSKADSKEIS
ncbi:hypothetical protein HD806DRAFT_510046 [Xylariaceae sp. AK1471]|nr:hypothetical protein HD806DRAFT_510046 [Xylariaceae sp. AK1471]